MSSRCGSEHDHDLPLNERPSLEVLRKFAYKTHSSRYRDFVDKHIASGFLLTQNYTYELLETWIILLHTGIQFEKLAKDYVMHLAAQTPSEFIPSFQRELGLIDKDEVVKYLVKCGFDEILQSDDYLTTKEELQYYMDRLYQNQVQGLLSEFKVPTVGVFIDRVISIPSSIYWPEYPPHFRTLPSLWNWHQNFIYANNLKWASKWQYPSNSILELFNPREASWNGAIRGKKSLLLSIGDQPQSLVRFEDQLIDIEDAANRLKKIAEHQHPIFGRSLESANVYFNEHNLYELAALSRRLIPGEVLTTESELIRYMLQVGSDVTIMDPIEASKLQVGFTTLIIFPENILSDNIMRLAVMVLVGQRLIESVRRINGPLPTDLRRGIHKSHTAAAWIVVYVGDESHMLDM